MPFDGLWEMAIDVPYSMLAGRGDLAWSCGQLALGARARVEAPGDLLAQADVVADHLGTILRRAGLDQSSVRRLVAYYVPETDGDGPALIARLLDRLGKAVIVDLVPVPVFYYDGVRLEIDLFCGEVPLRRPLTMFRLQAGRRRPGSSGRQGRRGSALPASQLPSMRVSMTCATLAGNAVWIPKTASKSTGPRRKRRWPASALLGSVLEMALTRVPWSARAQMIR